MCGPNATLKSLIDYEEFCGLRGAEAARQAVQADEITSEELKKAMDGKYAVTLIDVREPYEREICRLEPSKLIPMGSLLENLNQLDTATEYVLYCRTGNRSRQILDFLKQAGFQRVKHLKGGIMEWAEKIDPSLSRY